MKPPARGASKPPDPRAILRGARLGAKKSWGQSFLIDQRVLASIAAATGCGSDSVVLELGAGLGALTFHLLQRGARVIAVERDRDLVPLLGRELAWSDRLEIDEADAVRLDYGALAKRLGDRLLVAGNLPFQLASRIVVQLADAAAHLTRAVVLVQQEVGQRLASKPGSRTYGLLSVLVQRNLTVELLDSVPPAAFYPRPRVTSVLARLTPHGFARSADADRHLVSTARAAFSSRRKTLRNAIAGRLGVERDVVQTAISDAGLDPSARAETLSAERMAVLASALAGAGLLEA